MHRRLMYPWFWLWGVFIVVICTSTVLTPVYAQPSWLSVTRPDNTMISISSQIRWGSHTQAYPEQGVRTTSGRVNRSYQASLWQRLPDISSRPSWQQALVLHAQVDDAAHRATLHAWNNGQPMTTSLDVTDTRPQARLGWQVEQVTASQRAGGELGVLTTTTQAGLGWDAAAWLARVYAPALLHTSMGYRYGKETTQVVAATGVELALNRFLAVSVQSSYTWIKAPHQNHLGWPTHTSHVGLTRQSPTGNRWSMRLNHAPHEQGVCFQYTLALPSRR